MGADADKGSRQRLNETAAEIHFRNNPISREIVKKFDRHGSPLLRRSPEGRVGQHPKVVGLVDAARDDAAFIGLGITGSGRIDQDDDASHRRSLGAAQRLQ